VKFPVSHSIQNTYKLESTHGVQTSIIEYVLDGSAKLVYNIVIRDGVLEHWPRTRGQNSMILALASRLSGLGLEHSVLESIPDCNQAHH